MALLISSSALLPNSVLVAFSESGHLNSRNVFFWFDVEPSLARLTLLLSRATIASQADAERATAMGLHQAVYAIGMFGGPAVSGRLADAMGIRPMFGVTALFCLVLGMFVARWLTDKRAD